MPNSYILERDAARLALHDMISQFHEDDAVVDREVERAIENAMTKISAEKDTPKRQKVLK
jgi:hypothetical protein